MGLRAELQAFELHNNAAAHAAVQAGGHKVRQNDAFRVQHVARAAGQVRRVEVLEAQGNVVAGKTALSFDPFSVDRSFTSQIDAAKRDFRRAERFADIQQVEPCPVLVRPKGRLQIFGLRLQVQVRATNVNDGLTDGKSVLAQREFRRNVGGHGHIFSPGEFDRLPIERRQIQRPLGRATQVHLQLQLSAF